ncbi:MAG: GIY-YIG nuclease family protein [Chloroflexota bacterium]|nr:GIY-YIG nuclease family protein [Chloroflexota bacterium]
MLDTQALGFPKPRLIAGRTSIADIFRPSNRCGIYILYFSNGEYYVGQSKDVTRRFVQHLRIHHDIEKLAFKRVARKSLDAEEAAIAAVLEGQGHKLRNILLTSIPKGESDFDLIMPLDDQDRWVAGHDYVGPQGARIIEPELRRKYQGKFLQLTQMPYAERAITGLRQYVGVGIPAALQSEVSFWSCSCLPNHPNRHIAIYSRINLFWQEVFTAGLEGNQLWFSIHLALSVLEQEFGPSLFELTCDHPSVSVDHHAYAPGGPDQTRLVAFGSSALQRLLEDERIIRAIRLFNLRLMKKGPCAFSRYHCMDLADRLLATT